MAELELQEGESEVLHVKNVTHGMFDNSYREEFYLTNLHLICVRKGFFGKIKTMDKFVLNEIAIDEAGDARILIEGNRKNNGPKLQITFGTIPYFFYFMDKNTANEWGNTISRMLTGRAVKNATVEVITKAIKEIKTVIENELRKPAVGKCNSCGASISGFKGEMTTCPFCNSQQIL